MDLIHDYLRTSIQVDDRQQNILLKSYNSAIIVGVGGIGSWVALTLALTGQVKRIYIVDPDLVEKTNLNRTPFRICDIGKYKVDAIEELILERRLDIDVQIFRQKWNLDSHPEITNTDFIIDCRDDIFNDFGMYSSTLKIWKVGYDGLDITIDGNPRKTKVMGSSNGYSVVPSFVCSSQLAANVLVNHILMMSPNSITQKEFDDKYGSDIIDKLDYNYKLDDVLTFDSSNLIYTMYKLQQDSYKNEISQ